MPTVAQGDFPPPKSWDEFEDIVADLYRRIWNDPGATRYGRSGQPQQGVDIYGQPGHLEGGYAGIQCKRYDVGTLTRAVVLAEIGKAEEFTPPLAEYVIATTDRRDGKLQKAVREVNEARRAAGIFPVRIVFWEDLCSQLTHPGNRDLLQKHYPEIFVDFARPPFPLGLPPPSSATMRLIERIEDVYDLQGLERLSYWLDVDWENLPGDTKFQKAKGVVMHFQRLGDLPSLLERLEQERPHVDWRSVSATMRLIERIQYVYDLQGLERLSYWLDVDWENLPGDTKFQKAKGVVRHFQRLGDLPSLLERLEQERPHVDWRSVFQPLLSER
jgi:hypothetical protein